MAGNDVLMTMARYNQWANRELFAAVRALPEDEIDCRRQSPFESLINTLNYPLVMDRMWWSHLHQAPLPQEALDDAVYVAFEELAAAREDMDQQMIEYAAALSEASANDQVSFTLLNGAKGSMSRCMMLMHMFNQNTYHRGFAAEMFSQVPAALPLIDLSIFLRGEGGLRFLPPHLAAA